MILFRINKRKAQKQMCCVQKNGQKQKWRKNEGKKLEKAEMKESILTGEALALNDAELEGAVGGHSNSESEAIKAEMQELLEQMREARKGIGNLPEVPNWDMTEQELEEYRSELLKHGSRR